MQKEVKLFINKKVPTDRGRNLLFNQILIFNASANGLFNGSSSFSAVSYIFERRAYQLCFQIPFTSLLECR